jgi:hypothetical protein
MADHAEQLRALHRTPPMLVLPNAWDAASARLIESEGFPAIATTSAGVAAALGYPDGGVVPPNEMIEAIARIVRSVKLPVTADIEHAYAAAPDAVADVVLRVIAAGAVGINLEDCVPGATDLEPLKIKASSRPRRKPVSGSSSTRAPTAFFAASARRRRGSASPSNARRPSSKPAPTACSSPASATRRRSARWSRASAAP